MNKAKKTEIVGNLKSIFDNYGDGAVLMIRNKGLTVSMSKEIRNLIKKEASGKCLVVKNSLAKIAVGGTKYDFLKDQFTGPIAIACSSDPTTISKILVKFCKNNEKLDLICGAVGDEMLDVAQIKNLASLPSLEELRATIIGLLQAPAGKIASVLQAPSSQIVRVLDSYARSFGE